MSIWSPPQSNSGACTSWSNPDAAFLNSFFKAQESDGQDRTFLAVNPNKAAIGQYCLSRKADSCPIPISRGQSTQVTADITLDQCDNTWAALWLYPQGQDYTDNANVREIDIAEITANQVNQNFDLVPGGATWQGLSPQGFSKHRFHVYYDHQTDDIQTWACAVNPDGKESDCVSGGTYKNYLNHDPKLSSQNLLLEADIWNSGFQKVNGRMQASNGGNRTPTDANSRCIFTVENVKVFNTDGQGSQEALSWSDPKCKALDPVQMPSPAPVPPRPPAPVPPRPTPSCTGFRQYPNTDVAAGYGDLKDNAVFTDLTLDQCNDKCAKDEFCVAAVHREGALPGGPNCFLKGTTDPMVPGPFLPLTPSKDFTTSCMNYGNLGNCQTHCKPS